MDKTLCEPCSRGDLTAVRLALYGGTDLDRPDPDGLTPLMCAVVGNHIAIVALLLQSGANVNARARDGQTALAKAVLWDQGDIVDLLLAYGADPEVGDGQGWTPLRIATERRQAGICARLRRAGAVLLALALSQVPASAQTTHVVTNEAELRTAIIAAAHGDMIRFVANVTVTTGDLPALQRNVTIDGAGYTLDGGGQYRGLFIYSGAAAVTDLTIQQTRARGGSGHAGGGGGAGLGGALFVARDASLVLSNVALTGNQAVGGTGGGGVGDGGGGGMGGDAGSGGGGLGSSARGGAPSPSDRNGGAGIVTGAAPGGRGVGGIRGASGGTGGVAGGGGGSFGGGGGVGGNSAQQVGASGWCCGHGGFGGGGGSGSATGGFGGGGGGADADGGGTGGFGGGGGHGDPGPGGNGRGGFGGGDSADDASDRVTSGGGGAGMGGAIFVQQGGTLLVTGLLTANGNTVAGGPGGPDLLGRGDGRGLGAGFFLQGDGIIAFAPGAGTTQTVSDGIADQTGSGGTGEDAGSWSLVKSGAGTLVLAGAHAYTGATSVSAGTLLVNGSLHAAGAVSVMAGATLGGSGTINGAVTIDGGNLSPGSSPGRLTTGSLSLNAGSTLTIEINGTTPGIDFDVLEVAGTVSLGNATLALTAGNPLVAGEVFTFIENQGPGAIAGTFGDLPEGATFVAGGYAFRISYSGGDGNDVTLTHVTIPQTIAFTPLVDRTFGDAPFGVSASASSGFPVSFSSATPGVCAVSNGTVTIVAAGTCRIDADQAGDAIYAAAPQVARSFTVNRAGQVITFGALAAKTIGDPPFTIGAEASSGLAVTFASLTPAVCALSDARVTLIAPGACTIAADQAGSADIAPAERVMRSFAVASNCPSGTLGPARLAIGIAGMPYSQTLTFTGAVAPVAFSLTGTLPAGVTFADGELAGTPSERGAFPLAVTATDANGCQASASHALAIAAERRLVIGTGAGGPSTLRAFNLANWTARADAGPFGAFTGGVSVAQGDTNGDGEIDSIAGAGPGGGPAVTVIDGASGQARLAFFAFEPGSRSGVEVAAGDVTGDGIAEVIAAPGCAEASGIRAFDGRSGALVREYPIAAPAWSCGLHVAAGDITGDGIADLVLGAGGAGPSFVQVVDGASGASLRVFFPYDPGFTGGVYVAAADVTGDGFADIVTGAGPGGGPHVRIFDGLTGAAVGGPLGGFFAYAPDFAGGVRVGAGDLDGDGRAEVITGAGPGGGPHVRVWSGATATELYGLYAVDPSFSGGIFVAGPPAAVGMAVDMPAPGEVGTEVRVAGWALRGPSLDGSGIDAIHAWAAPLSGGDPVFVGATGDRRARPDVAAVFGGEFLLSGFDFVGWLPPGTYDLIVFARNSRTLLFDQGRVVRITVR